MREAVLNEAANFIYQNDGDEDNATPEAGVDGFDVFDIVRIFGGLFGHKNYDKKD